MNNDANSQEPNRRDVGGFRFLRLGDKKRTVNVGLIVTIKAESVSFNQELIGLR